MVTINDLTNYYNELSFIGKLRFRRICYHKHKMIKLETKLETIDELIEELG